MDAWAKKLNGSAYVDEIAAINALLRSKTFSDLTIEMLPSSAFPTANEITKEASSALKVCHNLHQECNSSFLGLPK